MANLSIFIMKVNITIFLTALSSRKRRGRMISAEDKAWLTNHTQHEPEHIDKLYREFQTDYPNGGIWRRLEGWIWCRD